jgi:TRAP-type mannitol/chloroaromatic compound transport system substrate-binding protein
LKGLKMRIPGLGGDVLAMLGASPVSLPGGPIYENLVSGAIDATEWVGPWNDYFLKFYEAAKYYYYPGMHEPGSMLAFGMNASWWGGLTQHEQNVIKFCARAENDYMMAEFNANNGTYLTKLIDEQGVDLKRFNEDVYDAFGRAADEVFAETIQHGDLTKRIHESFLAARSDVGSWMNIADVAYLVERNRVLGID